jgi:hypothetical protein
LRQRAWRRIAPDGTRARPADGRGDAEFVNVIAPGEWVPFGLTVWGWGSTDTGIVPPVPKWLRSISLIEIKVRLEPRH